MTGPVFLAHGGAKTRWTPGRGGFVQNEADHDPEPDEHGGFRGRHPARAGRPLGERQFVLARAVSSAVLPTEHGATEDTEGTEGA